ncbi:MAG: 1-acyl-sn-glycerol-3-phosphate acyltransferase [Planctomycetota bacterium]|nr:MAG: 1-acyl-sn-glycerol-3-phosphate acyltransferase [Planctomycetota bacterium]
MSLSSSNRSLATRLWYGFLKFVCRLLALVAYRIRCYGREHLPTTGGVLLLSNHQSNLDPVIVGLTSNRRLNYMARETLFRFGPFRWLIHSLDAIPIDREGLGLAGLKETLKRLRRGEIVLMFPEGTRTRDGELASIKPGFCALARRGSVPLVPVAIDGAFQAWPRSQMLPRTGMLRVVYGPPLLPSEIEPLDDQRLIAEIERRMAACFEHARASRRRALSARQPPGSPTGPDCARARS